MGGGGGDDGGTPLLQSTFKRTGNIPSAVAHIITAVIGSGVLSLAWSMAQLGWIAGPLSMLFFACVTFLSASLLSDCYMSLDPECGPTRNRSFLEAVTKILGKRSASICGILVTFNIFKTGMVYTITSAISMRAIQKSNCYHREGHEANCEYGNATTYMLLFGIIQILLSQIPDFRDMHWLSVVSAAMSFAYSIIGSALGLATVIGNGHIQGSIGGVSTTTSVQKVWLVAQALGDIAFAFPFPLILLEVQDTLKSPPSEEVTMKKASTVAVCITTFFYLCCGGFGYAAFGSAAPGNLLTGFGFYEPYWLIDFANACIFLHLLGGYQVFSQPLFKIIDRFAAEKFPQLGFSNNDYSLNFTSLPSIRLNPRRLCLRTAYVALTTAAGMLFPYFNQVIGVAGAFNFWPLVIYFPTEMYLLQKNIEPWTRKWIVLRVYSVVCFFVAAFALVGSLEGLLAAKFS